MDDGIQLYLNLKTSSIVGDQIDLRESVHWGKREHLPRLARGN
jgi:hypothetical protein